MREVLGAADNAFLFRFMQSVIAGDTAAVIGEKTYLLVTLGAVCSAALFMVLNRNERNKQ